jgi:hypothetical protein
MQNRISPSIPDGKYGLAQLANTLGFSNKL